MNLSIMLKIFREGILAALMGGFYIDFSDNAHFINVVHIYLWLILFSVPILIVMNHSNSFLAILVASIAVGVLVFIIKLITNHLHYLFDTSEAIEIVKNTDRSPKDENEHNISLAMPLSNLPKASATDQESMFHNESLENVDMGLNMWSMNKQDMAEEKLQIGTEIQQINENNLERNKSTELCILDLASRRPSMSRMPPRINSARSKIIDFRKSSCPAGPNQLLIQANSSLNDKYCRLMNPRNTMEFYQNELEKMKREISQLPIVVQDDFVPSTADLNMLDLQPTSRKVVKSISRNRSSSQRHCHSVHVNATSRVGSMRGNRLVVNDTDQSNKSLTRHRSQRRQSVSSTRTRKSLVQPVARSHSLKQAAHSEIGFSNFSSSSQMCRRVSVNTCTPSNCNALEDIGRFPGRRTQSFRNEDRPCFLRPNSTRLDIRSSHLSQMQVTVGNNGDLIRRKSSFSNPRRQIRAASIDTSSPVKPIFTIGSDNSAPSHHIRAMRKASLDMKSRSLEVPEYNLERGKLSSNRYLFKQNSFCVKSSSDHNESHTFDRAMSFTEENQSDIMNCNNVESTDFKLSVSDFDAMLAAQLSMEDEEINALLLDKDKLNIEDININQDNSSNEAINEKKFTVISQDTLPFREGGNQTIMTDISCQTLPLCEVSISNIEEGPSTSFDLQKEIRKSTEKILGFLFPRPTSNLTLVTCVRSTAILNSENRSSFTSSSSDESNIEGNLFRNLYNQTMRRFPWLTRLVRRNAINRGRPSIVDIPAPMTPVAVGSVTTLDNQVTTDSVDNHDPTFNIAIHPISGINPATHEDTSEGSVHLFQDESGQWMVYVFGDDSGTAIPRRNYLESLLGKSTVKENNLDPSTKIQSDAMTISKISDIQRCDSPHPDMLSRNALIHINRLRNPTTPISQMNDAVENTNLPGTSRNYLDHASNVRNRRREFQARLSNASMEQISMLDRILMTDNTRAINNDQFDLLQTMLGPQTNTTSPESLMLYDAIEKWFSRDKSQLSTKHYYYELALFPWSKKRFKVNFDRLQLTSLFDRSINPIEVCFSVILAVLVSLIGLSLLCRHLYYDMYLLLICFTMASAQYSLVKSVQPDACSPQHGFNRILVFSRATYFSLIAGTVLLLEILLQENLVNDDNPLKIFKITVSGATFTRTVSNFLQNLLLLLPLLHTLGLLPQLNTLLLFGLEQLDIHFFGSSGSIDIASASVSLLRNLIAVGVTFPLCYFGLKQSNPQNITYSLFWGIQLTTCYFLSRLPNSIHLYRCLYEHCPRIKISLPSMKGSTMSSKNQPNPKGEHLDEIDVVCNKDKPLSSSNIERRKSNMSKYQVRFENSDSPAKSFNDPLPKFMSENLLARIKNDFLVCIAWGILGFALHISTLFTHSGLQYILKPLIIYINVAFGFILHYLWPQLRKPYPWLMFTEPVFKPSENGQNTRAECFHYWFLWLYKNVLIPLLVMNEFTTNAIQLSDKFGSGFASIIIIVLSMKVLRCGFSAYPRLFLVILLTHLLFEYDFKHYNLSETFPINYLFVSIIFTKLYELWLKMNFVFIYIAPFQISWGSAFHAVAQLAFLPHSMLLLTQCIISSILSAPLEPFLASAIFLSSYVRPMKFWEQKYKTQRLETTNTALSSQVQGVSSEQVAGNLNSIFYEHLTRSLQKTLAGDLLLGRWGGAVEHGDMFILASEDLHFLVHIIEIGNGLVTFQLRGLEFAGTYCHEQETEELRTDLMKNHGFCCCNPGRLPQCLSLNVAFRLRWVAWEFVQSPFIIDGYRVNDHSATTTMQLYDLRKLIVTLYVQCIIYYTIKLPNVTENIAKLQPTLDLFGAYEFADLDPIFNKAFDDDFDEQVCGITRIRFLLVYGEWIQFCLQQKNNGQSNNISEETLHNLHSLCFGLSLLGRRSLGYTSSDKSSLFQQSLTDVFLHGLHDVFKGDVRVSKDDWIFEDVTLLQKVITPAVRVALKLYQDNLANPLSALSDLYGSIIHTEKTHVICHETEPQWRFAILNDADSLFSFRRIVKPNSGDGYRIIMFNKKSLQFKVIKINRECVRGLWSSQQREQIFLRNNDQERGSIQHARQVLRNLVNSSCDLPIGYPIYVSPLTTSLAGSHLELRKITGRELSLERIFSRIRRFCGRLQYRCTEACVPGPNCDRISKNEAIEMTKMIGSPLTSCPSTSCYKIYSNFSSNTDSTYDEKLQSINCKITVESHLANQNKNRDNSDASHKLFKIIDGSQVLARWHDKLSWPVEEWKSRIITGKTSSVALQGLEGQLIHKWTPFNPLMSSRSFCHLSIVLLSFAHLNPATNLTDKLALVFEKGLSEVISEEESIISEFV